MNKFEQVSSDHYITSRGGWGRREVGPSSGVQGEGIGPQVWCPGEGEVPRGTPTMWPIPGCIWLNLAALWADRCLWKHYLLTTLFASNNNNSSIQWFFISKWKNHYVQTILYLNIYTSPFTTPKKCRKSIKIGSHISQFNHLGNSMSHQLWCITPFSRKLFESICSTQICFLKGVA